MDRLVGDRLIVAAALVGVTLVGWAYLLYLSAQGGRGSLVSLAMARVEPWSTVHLLSLFLMWTLMMAAMMLPSAGRFVLAYVKMAGRRDPKRKAWVLGGALAGGYLALWTGFSAVAAFLQWGLYGTAVLGAAGKVASPWFGGAILMVAGVYQWTPLKHACLRKCRSPFGFLLNAWREGPAGAFRMGLEHGGYCVGCCAALMALLFAAGVMNLVWVALIAVFVLVEKLAPAGERVARAAGGALGAVGLLLVLL